MAEVTHPAPGYLTRYYTDNRRAATSSPAGGAPSSTGVTSRERLFPTQVSRPDGHCEQQVWGIFAMRFVLIHRPQSAENSRSRPRFGAHEIKLPAGHLGYWGMQLSPELLKAIQPLISGTIGADAKSAKGVHLSDLAAYIDERRDAAVKEFKQLQR